MAESSSKRRTELGAWLWNEIVERRKTSLRRFAEESEISHASISRWTKPYAAGVRPELPSRKMVKKLARLLNYKSGTIQALVDKSWADYHGVKVSDDVPTLSPQARLFAERFDKLPKVVRDALWRAAFGDEDLGDDD